MVKYIFMRYKMYFCREMKPAKDAKNTMIGICRCNVSAHRIRFLHNILEFSQIEILQLNDFARVVNMFSSLSISVPSRQEPRSFGVNALIHLV